MTQTHSPDRPRDELDPDLLTYAHRPWRRVAVAGCTVTAAFFAAVQLVRGFVAPPLVVFAAVFIGLAVQISRGAGRRWLYATAAFSVFVVVSNVPFIIEDLSHLENAVSFILGLVGLLAAVVTVTSSIMATRPFPPERAVHVVVGAASVFVAASIASVIAAAGLEDDPRRDGDVLVRIKSNDFPAEVTVETGGSLYVDNADGWRHTFTIEGTDVDQDLPASTARRVDLNLPPGTYAYICEVPGHDMTGTLTVI